MPSYLSLYSVEDTTIHVLTQLTPEEEAAADAAERDSARAEEESLKILASQDYRHSELKCAAVIDEDAAAAIRASSAARGKNFTSFELVSMAQAYV